MSFLSGKRLFLLGIVIILLIAIPLTAYLVQKQQETRSRAQKSTVLSFTPTSSSANPVRKNVNETFTFDVMIDPGTNEVIHTTLSINYDQTKLATADAGLSPTNALPSVLEGPIYSNGNATIVVSTGTDITKAINTPTKVATITFKALSGTGTTPTQITFGNQTTVTATIADPETNVLSTTNPAWVIIGATGITPTPTTPVGFTPTPTSSLTSPTPTPTPRVTSSITPTATTTITSSVTPTSGVGGISPTATLVPNQPPVCTALNVDRLTSGTLPLSITFTANGNDPDGTINKVSFNFGDGPVQDVTQAGGIGTNSVSTQVSHTYRNAGTFNATATLTDNNGALSNVASCTQVMTVSEASLTQSQGGTSGGTSGGTGVTGTLSPMPSPGPGNGIFGIGTIGALVAILGALVFFAL
ncbi:MAG: PKD domain-containing protein [bacterium]|nr:PKD domain-containing protein [bacterium]